MKYILLLIVILMATCLLTSNQLSAKPDYRKGWVISSTGDTLKGFINYQSVNHPAGLCSFKAGKEDKETDFHPIEIREFQFIAEGRKFVQGIVHNQNVFLEMLVQGKISLYCYRDETLQESFYIQKTGWKDKAILPFKREYKKNLNGYVINSMTSNSTAHIDTLKKYMDDAPEIYPDIEIIDIPAKDNLTKLVIQYNAIFGETFESLKPHKIIKPLGIYVSPGIIFSSSRVTELSNYTLFGGFGVSVPLCRKNGQYLLNSGIFMARFTERIVLNDNEQVLIHYNFLRIPVKLEYRLPVNAIQPRFSIGYNLYNSHLGTFMLSAFSAGVNVNLSPNVVISVLPEIEFKGIHNFSMLPNQYKSFNIFAGLEIKL